MFVLFCWFCLWVCVGYWWVRSNLWVRVCRITLRCFLVLLKFFFFVFLWCILVYWKFCVYFWCIFVWVWVCCDNIWNIRVLVNLRCKIVCARDISLFCLWWVFCCLWCFLNCIIDFSILFWDLCNYLLWWIVWVYCAILRRKFLIVGFVLSLFARCNFLGMCFWVSFYYCFCLVFWWNIFYCVFVLWYYCFFFCLILICWN